jgi:hypothetical protein
MFYIVCPIHIGMLSGCHWVPTDKSSGFSPHQSWVPYRIFHIGRLSGSNYVPTYTLSGVSPHQSWVPYRKSHIGRRSGTIEVPTGQLSGIRVPISGVPYRNTHIGCLSEGCRVPIGSGLSGLPYRVVIGSAVGTRSGSDDYQSGKNTSSIGFFTNRVPF